MPSRSGPSSRPFLLLGKSCDQLVASVVMIAKVRAGNSRVSKDQTQRPFDPLDNVETGHHDGSAACADNAARCHASRRAKAKLDM